MLLCLSVVLLCCLAPLKVIVYDKGAPPCFNVKEEWTEACFEHIGSQLDLVCYFLLQNLRGKIIELFAGELVKNKSAKSVYNFIKLCTSMSESKKCNTVICTCTCISQKHRVSPCKDSRATYK